MKSKKIKSLFGIFLLISLSFSLQAQVSIGSGEAPASGALLQMKQYTGGLGGGTRYRLGYDGNDEEMKRYYARNDDSILDGPFGNIAGSVWGEDYSTTYYADKLPMEEVVLYSNMASASQVPSNKTAATLFRHATLPFIWSGDGGFNSSNTVTTNATTSPFKIGTRTINGHTYTHFPIYRQNFGADNSYVQNAVFTANALAWCIKRADQLRKEQSSNLRLYAVMMAWAIKTAEFDGYNTPR